MRRENWLSGKGILRCMLAGGQDSYHFLHGMERAA